MFCYKCGKELPDDSEFCFDCGAKINVQPVQETTPSCPHTINIPTPTADVPRQGTYIADQMVKNKKSHKAPILITLVAVVASILIYVLFENGVNINNPIKTPTGGSLYDSALIGRWRSFNGSTIELDSDGSGYTSLIEAVDSDKILFNGSSTVMSLVFGHSIGDMTWSSENGKITFTVEHTEYFRIKYESSSAYSKNDEIICGSLWTMQRKENTVSSGNYIGTWCGFNMELTLNDDGTGEVVKEKTNIPIEWEFKQEIGRIYITYNMYHEFDYYKSDDSLTIYLSNSSMTFKKVSD